MRTTAKLIAATMFALVTGSIAAQAAPTAIFYSDRASFEAAVLDETLINFENYAAAGTYKFGTPNISLNGVTFSAGSNNNSIGISYANMPLEKIYGAPFRSDIMFSNFGNPIVAYLPAGVIAVGGFFGSLQDTFTGYLTLNGTSGVLATQSITAGDLGAGLKSTFAGFIVSGDTITSISYQIPSVFEGMDDFVYGKHVALQPVPEPAAMALVAGGLLGLAALRRRKSA